MFLKKKLEEPINMVFDTTNFFIYCFPKSATCAHSVTLGLMDTERALLQTDLPSVASSVQQFDLENDDLQFCSFKIATKAGERWIRHFPKEQLTKEILERKNIAKMRSNYLYSLEAYLRTWVVKSIYSSDESTISYLIDAIRSSDPANDEYSLALMEYAHILELDYKSAYQDLKMHTESAGLLKVRSHAQYKKYVELFNSCQTKDELDTAFKKMWSELCSLCRI
jgi:hypothetical protein